MSVFKSIAFAVVLGATLVAPLRAAEPDPREADVRALVERYFRTWSAQDIERYGACFMPQAVVQLVDPSGGLVTQGLPAFLRSQRAAHQQSEHRMTETPERIEIKFEQKVARVVVYWKLASGAQVDYGYDHFTLMQSGGEWRIANLIFYAAPKEGE